MDAEGDAGGQRVQGGQALRSLLGGLPVVRGHLEQGMDIRLAGEGDDGIHGDDGLIGKALVGSLLLLVGVRMLVEDLLQLPKMLRRRDNIEERAAGLQYPPEFLQRQGGEAV